MRLKFCFSLLTCLKDYPKVFDEGLPKTYNEHPIFRAITVNTLIFVYFEVSSPPLFLSARYKPILRSVCKILLCLGDNDSQACLFFKYYLERLHFKCG